MKRLLGLMAGLVLVAVTAAFAYVFAFTPRLRPPLNIHVDSTPENVDRGHYLVVNVLQCIDCHSERDWTLYGGPPKEPIGAARACMTRKTPTAGVNVGVEFFLSGRKLVSRNLTPDGSGLGPWTREAFIARFKAYRDPVPVAPEQNTLMNWNAFAGMTDDDLGAIYDFLRTLKPLPTGG